MPDLKEQVDEILEALSERVDWENELARGEAQRKCYDRSKVNNFPWPNASNVRYPLSDTLISQFTPFLFKILYSSERIAYFRSLTGQNAQLSGLVSDYFDFKTKNYTDLEREIQPCIDKYLQDGETILKILWDDKKECAYYEYVDNLFFITPSVTLDLEDAPWCVHAIQKSKDWIKRRFKDIEGVEDFIAKVESKCNGENDQGRRTESEYDREGISVSPKNKNIVLWEKHYKDGEGRCRIVTLSPDVADFDFQDDREYLYDIGGYMFEHAKFENIDKKIHSSRGIPRLVAEGEYCLTALERAKQNAMTLYNTPMFYSTGPVPSSTGNIQYSPGTFLPFPIQIAQMGSPPIDWDIEKNSQREKWERRVGVPDYGIGKANTLSAPRTATETKAISFNSLQITDYHSGNWRMFLGRVFKKGWKYYVERNKVRPIESLNFYLGGRINAVPASALSDEWQITITGSAETVNKESMTQKALTLWQMSQNNPYANVGEAYKNVLQNLTPGEVDRFYQDPASRQQEQAKKTASDLSVIVAADFPMLPDQNDDLLTAGLTALQFLQGAEAKQKPLTPQQVNLVSQYIAVCREGLKRVNPQGYQQLTQALNQADMQNQQKQQMLLEQRMAQTAPVQPPPPVVISAKKEIRKRSIILKDKSGDILGFTETGVEVKVDENGNEIDGPVIEKKTTLLRRDSTGKPIAADTFGFEQGEVQQ